LPNDLPVITQQLSGYQAPLKCGHVGHPIIFLSTLNFLTRIHRAS
jgi:hypothetical protein